MRANRTRRGWLGESVAMSNASENGRRYYEARRSGLYTTLELERMRKESAEASMEGQEWFPHSAPARDLGRSRGLLLVEGGRARDTVRQVRASHEGERVMPAPLRRVL